MISINDDYSVSPSKVVKGEKLIVSASTNIPFSRVEYSVELGGTHTDNSGGANDTASQIPLSFNNVGPNNNPLKGRGFDIVVTAYATINGKEFKSDPVTVAATVYNGNGYVWKSLGTSIDSFEQVFGHFYRQTTSHSVVYYNDDASRPQVTFLRKNGWWQGNDANVDNWQLFEGRKIDDPISLELAYSATFSASLSSYFTMGLNKFHGGHAVTGFDDLDVQNPATLLLNTRAEEKYIGDGIGLPATGSITAQSSGRKAIKLAD